jgi:hypothetical protein
MQPAQQASLDLTFADEIEWTALTEPGEDTLDALSALRSPGEKRG